jgi:hypothetical protein
VSNLPRLDLRSMREKVGIVTRDEHFGADGVDTLW